MHRYTRTPTRILSLYITQVRIFVASLLPPPRPQLARIPRAVILGLRQRRASLSSSSVTRRYKNFFHIDSLDARMLRLFANADWL